MTRLALVVAAVLTCNVALAETIPPTPTSAPAQRAQQKARREISIEWWLCGVAAVLSAATVVTTVVVATRPGGSLNTGVGTMGLTVRF